MSVSQDLTWYTSDSADDQNHDQEVDLDAIGSPGGASWASVAPDGQPGHKAWTWEVYNRWIDVDDEPKATIGYGETDTEDEAKAAVTAWVRLGYLRGQIRAESISYGEIAELQSLAGHIEPGDTELAEWAGIPEFSQEDGE